MATYAELLAASESDTLKAKVRVAIVIAADAVRTEPTGTTNHAARLVWARQAFADAAGKVGAVLWAVLAQNASLTSAQINNATDAQVQTAVNAAVDVLTG